MIEGRNNTEAASDIVLSSIGWVSVTSWNPKITFRALTPGGRGLVTRPPIVKYAIKFRGRRITGTAAYETRPLETLPPGFKPRKFTPFIPMLNKRVKKPRTLGKRDSEVEKETPSNR